MNVLWWWENLDLIVTECALSKGTLREYETALKLCEDHPEIANMNIRALRPLLREKNTEVQNQAIQNMKKILLICNLPKTGWMTGRDVKAIINKIRTDLQSSKLAMSTPEPVRKGA